MYVVTAAGVEAAREGVVAGDSEGEAPVSDRVFERSGCSSLLSVARSGATVPV